MAAKEGCEAGSGMHEPSRPVEAGSRRQSAHTVSLLSMRSLASSRVGSGAFSLRLPKMRFMLPASNWQMRLDAPR